MLRFITMEKAAHFVSDCPCFQKTSKTDDKQTPKVENEKQRCHKCNVVDNDMTHKFCSICGTKLVTAESWENLSEKYVEMTNVIYDEKDLKDAKIEGLIGDFDLGPNGEFRKYARFVKFNGKSLVWLPTPGVEWNREWIVKKALPFKFPDSLLTLLEKTVNKSEDLVVPLLTMANIRHTVKTSQRIIVAEKVYDLLVRMIDQRICAPVCGLMIFGKYNFDSTFYNLTALKKDEEKKILITFDKLANEKDFYELKEDSLKLREETSTQAQIILGEILKKITYPLYYSQKKKKIYANLKELETELATVTVDLKVESHCTVHMIENVKVFIMNPELDETLNVAGNIEKYKQIIKSGIKLRPSDSIQKLLSL